MNYSTSTCTAILFLLIGTSALYGQTWQSLNLEGGGAYAQVYDSTTQTLYASSGTKTYWLKKGETVWQSSNSDSDDLGGNFSQYLIVDDGILGVSGCCTLKHSSDQGKSWNVRYTFQQSAPLLTLTQIQDTLFSYTGSPSILYKSTNNGVDWRAIDTITFFGYSLLNDGRTLYITAADGLYRREDDGEWEMVGPNTKRASTALFADDTIFFQDISYNFFRSNDRGKTWEPLPQLGANRCILHNDTIWGGAYVGLYAMPLNGTAWEQMDVGSSPILNPTSMEFVGNQLIMTSGIGVYAWEPSDRIIKPFYAGWNNQIVEQFVQAGDSLIALTEYGLHITGPEREEWIRRSGPQGLGARQIAEMGGTLYALLMGLDTLYRSDDNAQTWTPHFINRDSELHPTVFHAAGDTVLVGGFRGIMYLTKDRGENWEKISFPSRGGTGDIAGTGSLFFVTIPTPITELYRSTDAGETWTPLVVPDRRTQGHILRYANSTVYLATRQHGLYRSFDQGENWERIESPFPKVMGDTSAITSILSLDVYGDTVFVHVSDTTTLSGNALYSSVNRGKDWLRLELPEDSRSIGRVVSPYSGEILIGTYGSGAYATEFALSSAQEVRRNQSNTATLNFNGRENQLEWELTHPSAITITLHSVDGRKVATLFEGNAEAGSHPLSLSNLALTAGNYICVLKMESSEVVSTVVPIL